MSTVVLVGAPGSGKSTIGALLAERLSVTFRDVDAVIVERTGRSITEIFTDDGEAAFRALEEQLTAELLPLPGVLSLGGGAVLSAATRNALRGHRVVWLKVGLAQSVKRVGLDTARPLLLGNVRGRLRKLLDERAALYREVATEVIDTDHTTPADVVQMIMNADALSTDPTRIDVRAERPYQVLVGYDLLTEVPGLLDPGAQRVALLHPPTMIKMAERLVHLLSGAGLEPIRIDVPDAEAAKSVAVAERCWSILGNAGFTRSDAIVGLGGGATTDLAGFVAATWLRGVQAVMVPTTLLGMVDAAVGGKTGINTAEGKNLVGCFYEPVGVVCDLAALSTLPTADLVAGLAEVIKCGFIADPQILTMIESDPGAAVHANSIMLRELVERAVSVKARVVAADLRETTSTGSTVGRELLNYGHTLGHAIERREHFAWRHGDAVSVGMTFAAELARLAGRLDQQTAARHRQVLSSVGLPTSYPADAFDDLLHTMALDKKARGSTLRFVILNGLASAEILAAPDEDLLRAAYAAVAA